MYTVGPDLLYTVYSIPWTRRECYTDPTKKDAFTISIRSHTAPVKRPKSCSGLNGHEGGDHADIP